MSPRTRTLPLTGLRSIHDARTRIFAAGRDPFFNLETNRLSGPRRNGAPIDRFAGIASPALFRANLLDQLRAPLTRRHE